MQRIGSVCVVAVLLGALAGCNTFGRQPRIEHAVIEPAALKPGDTAVITMKIKDRYGLVSRVEGVVREDPRVKLDLADDGVAPDEKAGDGVWTLDVDVPFQAPPGSFMLDFTAYRSDGQPLVVRDKNGVAAPLMQSFGMTIGLPEEMPEKSEKPEKLEKPEGRE